MYQEKDNIELKRELTDAVKKEIVAFLNTMNGTILVGVENDGNIYKPFQEENRDFIDTKVANWLQDTIYPLPSHLIKHYFNDDGVLVIEVNEGKDKPYYLREKGPKTAGVYKRVGRSIRKANEDEILRMIMSSKNYIYENDVSAKIDIKSFKRKEIVSYPGASLREMILNAFVHADYFIRSNIKIEFFEDRCKITSPGGMLMCHKETHKRLIDSSLLFRKFCFRTFFFNADML